MIQDINSVQSKPSFSPRGLSRVEAARYVGVSPSLFDEMIKDGRMPKPIRINSRVVWDRYKLDEAFESLDPEPQANPWDNDFGYSNN